jgi:hypothetical protein
VRWIVEPVATERASAADFIHLSEGEQWLKHMLEADAADTA